MTEPPFIEFDAEDFPITIEAYNLFGDVVWTQTSPTPGTVEVPMLRGQHGPIGVRIWTASGLHSDNPPPSQEYIDDLDARTAGGESP